MEATYFDQHKPKQRTRIALYTIIPYIVLVLTAALTAIPKLRALAAGTSREISWGPFVLFEVQKTALSGGGYEMGFAVRHGLFVLLLICFLVGALGAYLVRRHQMVRRE